jgi:hypothetical protein
MGTVIEDVGVYPTMIALSACLCAELDASGLGGACFCGIIPGSQVVLDVCASCGKDKACPGQAWVRLVSAFPSTIFPDADHTVATCLSPLAYNLEVGVARCFPQGKSNSITGFTPPTLDEQVNATRLQMADMAAMKRAIQCCMTRNDDITYALGQYTPMTVGGGCGGGTWSVTVWSI